VYNVLLMEIDVKIQNPDANTAAEPNPEPNLEKLERKLTRGVGKAIGDFKLIEEGDRIMVAVSGGKDSWVMLDILMKLQARAPVNFQLVAVNIDQGFEGFRADIIEDYLEQLGVEHHMAERNIARVVHDKISADTTFCSMCSRLRRGTLYGLAEELKCNKIALGHHLDDMIETLLLNLFFIGKTATMAPKLFADDGKNIVIRPLIYAHEKDIKAYTRLKNFPVVCCQCPLMCGETVHGDYKRRRMKQLINQLEAEIPAIRHSMLGALTNVKKSHMLDKNLFDFSGVTFEGLTDDALKAKLLEADGQGPSAELDI